MRYSASKYSMTLKTKLGVVQGHWKCRSSIDHIRFVLFRHCKSCSILYRFWVVWRWLISWPWNLSYRSLKVIQNGTIRKLGCGFLFAFHSNYGSILHQFRDKARYLSQIVIFTARCICISAVYVGMRCLSVRLSVLAQLTNVTKISSKFFHHVVAKPF